MAYTFVIQGQQTDVFCHMTEITGCGTGGWTLTMKIDGAKDTFGHSSSYWSNKIAYNQTAGKTGFDSMETKMPSYWGVSFSAICVGFTVNGVTNFATIPYTATSLHDVIASGSQRAVALLGKSKWQSMIAGTSMQPYCNREGFNLQLVRIGIMTNNENDCGSTDSFIGYGGSVGVYCGNRCYLSCSNGDKAIAAVGYILVK
ncbi:uncharacterized skeletal organic matrix protein 5-like [Actinia tenebrosa]|uniref:Uncharacterized skeletal organic matrix protein 5-like n=1 Tax=Actinia tenebrosa TaxID=6105 RepID=A0A6P8H5T0_ACTTE|nr:uncharacterized skeletal organic matrix protein 5-like [Actinia tenebrosa]